MIVFDLECRSGGHRFEGWFGSSDDFASQQARGFLCCPQCGSPDVTKAPMAPKLARKGNQQAEPQLPAQMAVKRLPVEKSQPMTAAPMADAPMPPEAIRMMKALAKMQAEALKTSRWVGDSFAEDARAMHYGEREAEVIHGQATLQEAQEMLEEGIAVAPLPFPLAPPGKAN